MKNILVVCSIFLLFSCGCKKEASTALFTTDKSSYYFSEPIILTNMSTEASKYLWDFGDQTTSTEISPSHIYHRPGTYLIKLKTNGDESSYEQTIRILDGIASFQVKNISPIRFRWVNYYIEVDGKEQLFNFYGYVTPGSMSDTSFTYVQNVIVTPFNDDRERIINRPVSLKLYQHQIIEVDSPLR